MRRLNDWFTEFYQNLPSTRSTNRNNDNPVAVQSPSNTNANEPSGSGISSLNTEIADDNSDENSNDEGDTGVELKKKETETVPRPFSLSPVTKCLINSRLKFKQAARSESNVIKNKPSPKVKMTYTGHRNSRTMVIFIKNIQNIN